MAKQSLNLPYILLCGAILIAIIASFAAVRPAMARLQAAQQLVQQVQVVLVAKQEFLLGIDRKRAELQGEQLHEKQLGVVLPVDESMDDVARLLHKAGEATGVAVTRLNNSGEGERIRMEALRARGEASDVPPNVAPIGVEIQAAGNYQQLRQFVERLEHSPRIIDIITLKISRNATAVELLNLDMRVRLYEHEKGVIR